MELDFITALEAQLKTSMPQLKTVARYNNQFAHSNGTTDTGRDNVAFDYPCVFLEIEYGADSFKDLLSGVQQVTFNLTTHLGFKSFKNEDLSVLQLKQDLFKNVYRFRQGNFVAISRTNDIPDTNYNNIQIYKTIYRVSGKDFTGDIRPTLPIPTGTTLTVSATTNYTI